MCELFGLSSRWPTTTTFSLQHFARRGGGKGPVDGWGLGFHDGRDVRLYKEPEPAADSAWLAFIQERRLSSSLVLSHIRRATQGAISLVNTQPFARELSGTSSPTTGALTASNAPTPTSGVASGPSGTRTRRWRSASSWSVWRRCG